MKFRPPKNLRDLSYQLDADTKEKLKVLNQQCKRRDGYKCQFPGCTKCGAGLQTHHIRKWADYPHLRFEITNVISLCKDHHKMIKNNEEIYAPIFTDIVNRKE